MLSEHDLPTTGDKDTLTRRHERWVLLYNANLDRNPPDRLTYDEMKRDLKKWEETRGGKKKVGVTDVEAYQVRVLPSRSGSEQKCWYTIGFLQKANKSEFDKLIAAARPKKPPTKPNAAETPEQEGKLEEDVKDIINEAPSSQPAPTIIFEQAEMQVDEDSSAWPLHLLYNALAKVWVLIWNA